MRVKLYSVIMLAVVTFTACSNDEMSETQTQKGLTLSASVENLSTRASMTDESGTWKFAFETNDQVSVSNSKITEDYTFQKTGEQFTCANAMATNEAADWYAYFPSNNVDLTGQTGTLNGVANYLAAAGKTTQATTGKDGLAITLSAKVAVLRIVEADKVGALDICVKNTADGKWVTGLSAQKNETKFNVKTSDTQTTLFSQQNVKAGDFSYVVVPAGMGIEVWNGGVLISKTTTGLAAGKYYTITSVPTKGQSHATINGKDELVGWVQLWPGGPRFATQNVDKEMDWHEAAKTGKDFAWGENWRTPNAYEITEVVKDSDGKTLFGGLLYDFGNLKAAEGSPSVKIEKSIINNIKDDIVIFTGVYAGYTKTQLTLYNKDNGGYSVFDFWTSSEGNDDKGSIFRIMTQDGVIVFFGIDPMQHKDRKYWVRPVLAK
ncbi:fimbrillin family protein [Segatella hominis]|uniref:fimbrillin family protein n=1 Tax=Segatella hominis TaxID=2518605 RepID=UPI001C495EF1|nr:fimbrillin family protein [Segatella hominis]WOZ82772.1 fimbrillin family protein [Segatella hominis]